jgi:hypothetical protein
MPVVANIRLDGMRKPIIRSHIDAAAGLKAWSAAASPETPNMIGLNNRRPCAARSIGLAFCLAFFASTVAARQGSDSVPAM